MTNITNISKMTNITNIWEVTNITNISEMTNITNISRMTSWEGEPSIAGFAPPNEKLSLFPSPPDHRDDRDDSDYSDYSDDSDDSDDDSDNDPPDNWDGAFFQLKMKKMLTMVMIEIKTPPPEELRWPTALGPFKKF